MNNVVNLSAKKAKRKSKPKTLPLSIRDAQSKINELAKDSLNVFIPSEEHAEERQSTRDFTRADIIEILRDGIIRKEPEWDGSCWRYKIEVPGFRGRIGAAVVSIIMDSEQLLIVTVMWLDRRW